MSKNIDVLVRAIMQGINRKYGSPGELQIFYFPSEGRKIIQEYS